MPYCSQRAVGVYFRQGVFPSAWRSGLPPSQPLSRGRVQRRTEQPVHSFGPCRSQLLPDAVRQRRRCPEPTRTTPGRPGR